MIFEIVLSNEYGSRLKVCIEAETMIEATAKARKKYGKLWPIVVMCKCPEVK